MPTLSAIKKLFSHAADAGSIKHMQEILQEHPDAINWTEREHYNAMTLLIHGAVKALTEGTLNAENYIAAAEFLIAAGIDLNWQDSKEGATALHHAMFFFDDKVRDQLITLLVKHGARIDIKDFEGNTVEDIAADYGVGRAAAIDEGRRQAARQAAEADAARAAAQMAASLAAAKSQQDLNARLAADTRRKKFLLSGPG